MKRKTDISKRLLNIVNEIFPEDNILNNNELEFQKLKHSDCAFVYDYYNMCYYEIYKDRIYKGEYDAFGNGRIMKRRNI